VTGGASQVYRLDVAESDGAWTVHILDDAGRSVFDRACAGEAEARLFASTVGQHLRWLSPEKFRQYYRISEPGPGAGC
jgi:hypothetical protein